MSQLAIIDKEDIRQSFTKCKLDPKQVRKWIETRTKLLYDAPMFSHLIYTMMSKDDNHAYFTKDIPVAATDDSTLFINPDGFMDRPIGHRVFITAHEVCHAMFGHNGMKQTLKRNGQIKYADGTTQPYKDDYFDQAIDYFVNALLVESKIGDVPPDVTYDPRYTSQMSVLDIYKQVYVEQEQPGSKPPPSFDEHKDPGTGSNETPEQAMQQRDQQEWDVQMQAGMASAKVRGLLPAALEAALVKEMEPVVDWQDHITNLFHRKIGKGSYDWTRPDRRAISRPDPIFMPGQCAYGADLIVVVADSSRSIGSKTASMFFAEMGGILENLNPREIKFVWCDAVTHGWEDIGDPTDLEHVERAGIKGGGGTSFKPPFAELEQMGLTPDALVYLTDGYGDFPDKEPDYPVIWGDITGSRSHYPKWGDVVHVPAQHEDD